MCAYFIDICLFLFYSLGTKTSFLKGGAKMRPDKVRAYKIVISFLKTLLEWFINQFGGIENTDTTNAEEIL